MNNDIEEFWAMTNSSDERARELGYIKWRDFNRNNPCYFDSIKHKFTKKFVSQYKRINLHDFRVVSMSNGEENNGRNTFFKLVLYDFHEEYGKDLYYVLSYKSVISYSINVSSTLYGISWYCDILESVDEIYTRHRILCSDDTSIELVFKSISMEKLKMNP